MTKRKRKIHTMTLDPEIYQRYRAKCKAMGSNASREVEKVMRKMLNGE